MIVNLLTKALRDKIGEAVKEYRLPVKNGAERPPIVFNGYLPPKRSNMQDDFPCVVVRPARGKMTAGDSEAETTVEITVCNWTEEFDGHEYCINVMQRIAEELLSMPDSTLANKYILQEIEWDLLEEQPYPQWQLNMTTKWAYIAPQCEF